MSYQGHILTDCSRQQLSQLFPPLYSEWIGDHITECLGLTKVTNYKIGDVVSWKIVGYQQASGIEVLVVQTVDGISNRPSDGKLYHITWSIDRSFGRKPSDSNAILQDGYCELYGNKSLSVVTQFQHISQ